MAPLFRAVFISLVAGGFALCMAEPADAAGPASVTFRREAPVEGDVAAQSVATGMSMDISVHLGQQIVHEGSTRVDRAQERVVRLTHVEPGVRMSGEVTYRRADETKAEGSQRGETISLPVAGKTYRVERVGEELTLLDSEGQIPPQDEFELVWQSMESFGAPNPLAEFLAGRTVAVGEDLELPTDAAAKLLAIGEDVVAVERFSLTLRDVAEVNGSLQAVFAAMVTSRTHGSSQMGMQVEGTLVVDAATCRVASLELAGPVGLTQTQTNGVDTYLVSGRGKIRVAMRGEFGAE